MELVDRMFGEQGRAATGAANILRTLSAMAEDAITDERSAPTPPGCLALLREMNERPWL